MKNIDQLEEQKNTNFTIWDNSKRAKNIRIAFIVLIIIDVIAIISGLFENELLKDIQAGFYIEEEAIASDM